VGGLTVSGVSRNRGSFVKCVAIQKRLGIPDLNNIHNHMFLPLSVIPTAPYCCLFIFIYKCFKISTRNAAVYNHDLELADKQNKTTYVTGMSTLISNNSLYPIASSNASYSIGLCVEIECVDHLVTM
jgi:hypothetical protein